MISSSNNIPTIPKDTGRAARSVYSQSDFFLIVGDHLEEYVADFQQDGAGGIARSFQLEQPYLAMITIFQFKEKLSDAQAVEATRTRLDWKYALHLSLNYPGMPVKFLCEYRRWLIHQPADKERFQELMSHMAADGLLHVDSGQPLEAARVIDEVCTITRTDQIAQAFQSTLEVLAIYHPEWLRKISLVHWLVHKQSIVSNAGTKLSMEDRLALMETLGADCYYLINRYKSEAQSNWTEWEKIKDLEELWTKQYEHLPSGRTKLLDRCANC